MASPPALITGLREPVIGRRGSPPVLLISVVVPVARSYRYTPSASLGPARPGTRLVPRLVNATQRPSTLTEPSELAPSGVANGPPGTAWESSSTLGSVRSSSASTAGRYGLSGPVPSRRGRRAWRAPHLPEGRDA